MKPPTILTNLQRGNVKQESPILMHQRTIHELAAQGELYSIDPLSIDAPDDNGMTPLHWAAGYGQNSTAGFLLRLGANPNIAASGGRTALMFAASEGFHHVVKTLVAGGAQLDAVDDVGNSALMYAAHQNQAIVVQELLRNGANLTLNNIHGQSAYSIAATKDNKFVQASIELHLVAMLKDYRSSLN